METPPLKEGDIDALERISTDIKRGGHHQACGPVQLTEQSAGDAGADDQATPRQPT